jgi:hypothetical protein
MDENKPDPYLTGTRLYGATMDLIDSLNKRSVDPENDFTVFCGAVVGQDGPGTTEFDRLLKIIAHAMSKVGSVINSNGMHPGRIGGPSELPHDVLAARQKLVDAHALLIGAEALMRSAHVAARSK